MESKQEVIEFKDNAKVRCQVCKKFITYSKVDQHFEKHLRLLDKDEQYMKEPLAWSNYE